MSQYVQTLPQVSLNEDDAPVAPPIVAEEPLDLFSLNGFIVGLVISQVDWALVRNKKRPKGWFPKYDARYHALWLATSVGYGFAKKAMGK